MNNPSSDAMRIEELLIERATSGLEPAAAQELETLLAKHPELDDPSWELAAAELEVEMSESFGVENMPATLRAQIEAAGRDQVKEASRLAAATREPAVTPSSAAESASAPANDRPGGNVIPGWFGAAGWLAAAAIALFAFFGLPGQEGPAPVDPLAAATDRLSIPWTATEDPAASDATGEVVWSTDAQRGNMIIRGLEVNDPSVSQYQLWIFDGTRDQAYPVDGGVFDIREGVAEVIVPIDAKIDVREPVLFAITVEKPGGVVVSDRERIVLIAEVAS